MKRFFLDQDNDSHWFLIPVAQRAAWETWLNSNQDLEHEGDWEVPEWAVPLNGHPNQVEFSVPKHL